MDFCSLFFVLSPLTFTLISHFSFRYVGFPSSSDKKISKLKKRVGQSKPPTAKPKQYKLAVVKNTSFKLKRRSHRIAPKLEFSKTQDHPIEIEEAKEKGSVQREKIGFTKNEYKRQDS